MVAHDIGMVTEDIRELSAEETNLVSGGTLFKFGPVNITAGEEGLGFGVDGAGGVFVNGTGVSANLGNAWHGKIPV